VERGQEIEAGGEHEGDGVPAADAALAQAGPAMVASLGRRRRR
jgi:hypothetical protein